MALPFGIHFLRQAGLGDARWSGFVSPDSVLELERITIEGLLLLPGQKGKTRLYI